MSLSPNTVVSERSDGPISSSIPGWARFSVSSWTALLGAVLALWGVWELSGPRDPSRWVVEPAGALPAGTQSLGLYAGFLLLAVVGFAYQLRARRRAEALALTKQLCKRRMA